MITLPVEVYTVDQIGELIWELEQALEAHQHDKIRAKVVAKGKAKAAVKTAPLQLSSAVQEMLEDSLATLDDEKAIKALIKELKDARDKAPVVHLTLSAYPNSRRKQQIIRWLRREVSAQILCTFVVNRDIGGGLLLRIGANQYDFTFRTAILENKQRIAELVHHG